MKKYVQKAAESMLAQDPAAIEAMLSMKDSEDDQDPEERVIVLPSSSR